MKVRDQYQIDITKCIWALANYTVGHDINWAWENIKDYIKTSTKQNLNLHELKRRKAWFDEVCLGFLDQRKLAKMQEIQDPSETDVNNLNNVRCEARVHFRNKKLVYPKAKFEELEAVRSKIYGTCTGASDT